MKSCVHPGYAPNFRKLVVNSPGGSIHPAYLIGKGLQAGPYEVQVAVSIAHQRRDCGVNEILMRTGGGTQRPCPRHDPTESAVIHLCLNDLTSGSVQRTPQSGPAQFAFSLTPG